MSNRDHPNRKTFHFILLPLIVLFTVAVRFHLLGVPIDRDEGEFARMGQLILNGIPPYRDLYSMKPPGIFLAYALNMKVFGQSAEGIHMGLVAVNAATVILVFLIALRLFDRAAAIFAAGAYALLSLSATVLGSVANATHFVNLFFLGGLWLLLIGLDGRKAALFACAGIAFGISCTMKQHAIFLVAFGFLFPPASKFLHGREYASERLAKEMLLLAAGFLVVVAGTILALYLCGVLDKFWFWTFRYPRELINNRTWRVGLSAFANYAAPIAKSFPLLTLLVFGGIAAICRRGIPRDRRVFMGGLLLASLAAISPGFYFIPHYFVLLLPAAALSIGAALRAFPDLLPNADPPSRYTRHVPAGLLLLSALLFAYAEKDILFLATPAQASRRLFGGNPYPESAEIGKRIAEITASGEPIAVLGSEPQIYFYAQRPSATRYSHLYGLMEHQKYALEMQREMIGDIETARPRILVLVGVASSWLARPNSPALIFTWSEEFISRHYRRIGVVDIIDENTTYYVWGRNALFYTPLSEAHIMIYERSE